MKGRTVLIIAHRLSTVKDADKVVVIKDGKIMEEGTHDALLQQDGLYRQLVKRQLQTNESRSHIAVSSESHSSSDEMSHGSPEEGEHNTVRHRGNIQKPETDSD